MTSPKPRRERKPKGKAYSLLVFLFCAPIALFAGQWTLGFAGSFGWRAGALPSHEIVEAEVVDKTSRERRKGPDDEVLVWAWIDEEGSQHQGSQPVADSTYARTDIGDPITVLVDEQGQSLIPGLEDNAEPLLMDAMATLLLGMVSLIFGMAALGALKNVFGMVGHRAARER